MKNKKYAVLSLSGGMDSSTLLLHLLANDYEVTALSFDYGQKHRVELERATELVEYINENSEVVVQELEEFDITEEKFPPVKHQIIKIDGLGQLLNSTLVEGGSDVPEGHYAEENMKVVGNCEYGLIFYRDKLPKFRNNVCFRFQYIVIRKRTLETCISCLYLFSSNSSIGRWQFKRI